MAGFVENNKPSSPGAIDRIRQSVKNLSTFGMKYDDMVIRNSQAVGVTEASFLNKDGHAGKEELVMAFEEEFGSEISDSEAEKILTVGDAIRFIENNPAK